MIKLFGLRIMTSRRLQQEKVDYFKELLEDFPDGTKLIVRKKDDYIYLIDINRDSLYKNWELMQTKLKYNSYCGDICIKQNINKVILNDKHQVLIYTDKKVYKYEFDSEGVIAPRSGKLIHWKNI